MNVDKARDDLAFMRGLVQPDEAWQRNFGEVYAAAGACYGVQMILHGAQMLGFVPLTPLLATLIGFGPTVVFVALFVWISRRNRARMAGGGVTSRAVGYVFSAVGLTNLAMIAIMASVAWREQNLKIWLIYPCLALVLQGAAWLVAYMLRRRAWLAIVALGWFAIGIGMAAAIENLGWFILVGGVGFIAFMLIPGLFIMRQSVRV